MTGLEIIHGLMDASLTAGVLYALVSKRGRRARALGALAPPTGGVVELWKGDHLVGTRDEGHSDIVEALNTKGMYVRWPDGKVQDRP